MDSKKAVPTTATSRRSAITHCSCSMTAGLPGGEAATRERVQRGRLEELLVPEIDRQQAEGQRVAFRADAAFARPEIYEALEARGVQYAIRIPVNNNLELAVEDVLFSVTGSSGSGRCPCRPVDGRALPETVGEERTEGGRSVRKNVGGFVPRVTIRAARRVIRCEIHTGRNPDPRARWLV